jgi:hypothetical protein
MQNPNKVVCVIRFRDHPTRAENQFGDGAIAGLEGVGVNPNGALYVPLDPGIGTMSKVLPSDWRITR